MDGNTIDFHLSYKCLYFKRTFKNIGSGKGILPYIQRFDLKWPDL